MGETGEGRAQPGPTFLFASWRSILLWWGIFRAFLQCMLSVHTPKALSITQDSSELPLHLQYG